MKNLIAVVDDEPDILELIDIHLKKANYETVLFENAKKLYDFLDNQVPDLLLLDLMLPDIDGMDVCKFIKSDSKYSSIPIIILSAKGEELDKVLGLEFGADDYVTKPFSPRELTARIKAVLRRSKPGQKNSRMVINSSLVIDLKKYNVFVDEEKIDLTTTEFKILRILAEKRGWVFSREQILERLWGNEKIVLDRTIDVHIKKLRDKLGESGKLIKNIRGVGYKLEE